MIAKTTAGNSYKPMGLQSIQKLERCSKTYREKNRQDNKLSPP